MERLSGSRSREFMHAAGRDKKSRALAIIKTFPDYQ
jgi:hypothetical protein